MTTKKEPLELYNQKLSILGIEPAEGYDGPQWLLHFRYPFAARRSSYKEKVYVYQETVPHIAQYSGTPTREKDDPRGPICTATVDLTRGERKTDNKTGEPFSGDLDWMWEWEIKKWKPEDGFAPEEEEEEEEEDTTDAGEVKPRKSKQESLNPSSPFIGQDPLGQKISIHAFVHDAVELVSAFVGREVGFSIQKGLDENAGAPEIVAYLEGFRADVAPTLCNLVMDMAMSLYQEALVATSVGVPQEVEDGS